MWGYGNGFYGIFINFLTYPKSLNKEICILLEFYIIFIILVFFQYFKAWFFFYLQYSLIFLYFSYAILDITTE